MVIPLSPILSMSLHLVSGLLVFAHVPWGVKVQRACLALFSMGNRLGEGAEVLNALFPMGSRLGEGAEGAEGVEGMEEKILLRPSKRKGQLKRWMTPRSRILSLLLSVARSLAGFGSSAISLSRWLSLSSCLVDTIHSTDDGRGKESIGDDGR